MEIEMYITVHHQIAALNNDLPEWGINVRAAAWSGH